MHIALIQANTQLDKAANLAQLEQLITDAARTAGPDLIVTPELCTYLGGTREEMWAASEDLPQGEAYALFAGLAKSLGVGLHVGSLLERQGDDLYNAAVAFDRNGDEIARYRKMHLFDIETPAGHVFKESSKITAGQDVVTYPHGEHRVGMAICYDVRFAALFRALRAQGADIITVPAAFNAETGRAHWEVLLRARAIETQCYILAAAQIGPHPEPEGTRHCHGNSMVVDPWGQVIARAPDTVGWIDARLDFDYLNAVRTKLPVAQHHVL